MFGRAPQGPYEGGEVSVNNNINKSPVVGEQMSNTTHKTEERRFQEERRDVMKMDRFFTGLVALVAGLALSAGSAYATEGYVMGNPGPVKLVPHYEIGDTKATIIGVQNIASGDNDSNECQNTDTAMTALTDATAVPQCAMDFDRDDRTAPTLPAATLTALDGSVVTAAQQMRMATAQANADDAQNLVVTAVAYGPSGEEQHSADICLAPGGFGYFSLQMMGSDMDMDMANGAVLTMADGIGVDGMMTSMDDAGRTITEPAHVYKGFVVLSASHRVTFCDGRKTPNDEPVRVNTPSDNLPRAATGTDAATNRDIYITNPAIAAWTIVQDVGDGFFGVEVPTPSVTMARTPTKVIQADSLMLDCYDTDDDAAIAGVANDAATATGGNEVTLNASQNVVRGSNDEEDSEWNMMKCGLIPERHNNDRRHRLDPVDTAGGATAANYPVGAPDTRGPQDDAAVTDGTAGFATPRARAFVRYDTMDETMVYAWMGAEGTALDITVHCEEGMETEIDDPSADTMSTLGTATIMVPGMTKMIDPAMGEVGDFTETCMGTRGVLEIMMPDGSNAGMVWSHIKQMDGHYRMNFPGYSMADPTECRTVAGDVAAVNDDELARIANCM